MAKFAAAMINMNDITSNLSIVIDENCQLKLFSTELQAEKYIKKFFASSYVFYGLIPDPTPTFKTLKLEKK